MPDLDYFSANLTCPACDTVVPVALDTDIQPDAHGAYLHVGSRVQLGPLGVAEGKYLAVRLPVPGEQIKLLHPWDCSVCGADNWVQITLDGTLIVDIKATSLSRLVLDQVHFIWYTLEYIYPQITGVSLYEPLEVPTPTENFRLRSDWIERLREKLD